MTNDIKTLDDKKFYQLELVNRETNFNKVFNASPNVGVINPLVKQKKKNDKSANRFISAPNLSALEPAGTGHGPPQPTRLEPIPNSPIHDLEFNSSKPLPQPSPPKEPKKFVSFKMLLNSDQIAFIGQVFESYVTEHHKSNVLQIPQVPDEDVHCAVVMNAMTLFETSMEVGEYFNAFPNEVLPVFDNGLCRAAMAVLQSLSQQGGHTMKQNLHARISASSSTPATCRDYQEIKIQEQVQRLSVGSIPQSVMAVVEDDLVDSCKSGKLSVFVKAL
ncbi:UNVERIFIED_CONTAM: hypothetical protein FKN15_012498 [Acipenser sinensis]